MTFEEMYNFLEDVVGVDGEALDLAFSLNGCNEETAEDILFYYTGWHSFSGYMDDIGFDVA